MTGMSKKIQATAEEVDTVQTVQKPTQDHPQIEDAQSNKEYNGGMFDQGGCCIL
jgi:hypothetical protein